jgi:hypothetical protein
MKKLFFIAFTLVSGFSFAQSQEDSVKMTINKMFEGMKNADVSLLKSVFADSAILQTIGRAKDNKVLIRNEDLAEFIGFIGRQPKGAADERITFETVKVDGALAIAWTPYKFYFNGQFSHCGVNSFQLVKLSGEWKIQYIIDTRRRQGCE